LPQHEFGLDVIAPVGRLRHAAHRSIPEIHAELARRGVPICARSVTNLLDRYDELLALSCGDAERLRRITERAGRVILAIDGLQPDVGHEVPWVLREVISGEVLLARSLLASTRDDLVKLLGEVKAALPVPIAGVVSDGQTSIRNAVKKALGGVHHQVCRFHYLREAATPAYEADRHTDRLHRLEAGGFGSRLKARLILDNAQPSSTRNSSSSSVISCVRMYSMITSSVTFPELATKNPRAQR
jgi:hypothetical protein